MAAKPWQLNLGSVVNIPLGGTVASASVPNGHWLVTVTGVSAYVATGSSPSTQGATFPVGSFGPFYVGEAPQGWPPVNSKLLSSGTMIYAQTSGSGNGQLSFVSVGPTQ